MFKIDRKTGALAETTIKHKRGPNKGYRKYTALTAICDECKREKDLRKGYALKLIRSNGRLPSGAINFSYTCQGCKARESAKSARRQFVENFLVVAGD